ncbi:putative fkbp-type peptidyl-prolyl protein [Phaeoacremonium minimum UCRPA7]|uniref:peptidylprolyl isomerase n=1 Tax=Phaeoacremonium minimum (strain UCR-PA7) TaxID=1286976 RepID=R8BSR8_PHAM7|nr:putative fkbp-type peptidyl-prolyl protein [Phaeoacremonium minimum UCRPA7]EOO02422.1 putative fkbp-type peptidyl-prolyl protein [Phaeoacremonium minimum UCRPA7]
MSPLQPVALFGLEVPPGEVMIPVQQDFPATIRITMAAIDPTEEVEEDSEVPRLPRSTLKLIKQRIGDIDEDEDEDDEYLRDLLLGAEDDDDSDEEEESDEEANGGPSDPSKSKKARRAAALKKLMEATQDEDSDEEMDDDEKPKANGVKAGKGKEKALEEEDDDEEEDSEEYSDDEDDLPLDNLEQFVVCTLDTERNFQQPLEVTINEGEHAFFIVSGTHTIHLTGNYVIDEDAASDSEEDSDDEDYDLPPELEDLVGDESESEDELDDIDEISRVKEIDTDEEEAPKLVEAKKGKNKRKASEDADGLDELIAKESKTEEPKLSKKQAKKLKNNEGKPVEVEKEAAKDTPTKADKKVQFAKNLEQGPTGSAAEKAKQGDKKAGLGVKVVQGVTVDDRKLGSGRTVKSGDRVGMRYIGKLENGKVFDSNKKGAPFSFRIGKGEVIKGWDIGIAGMSVGGERRLTIPAHLAYGSKGVPGIPANSTLIFDVKLLEIK